MEKMKYYYLSITYPESGQQHLMSTANRAISAIEQNKHLLLNMGATLLEEGKITSYQLLGTETKEFNKG
jgi:hypothetical protein